MLTIKKCPLKIEPNSIFIEIKLAIFDSESWYFGRLSVHGFVSAHVLALLVWYLIIYSINGFQINVYYLTGRAQWRGLSAQVPTQHALNTHAVHNPRDGKKGICTVDGIIPWARKWWAAREAHKAQGGAAGWMCTDNRGQGPCGTGKAFCPRPWTEKKEKQIH